MVIAHQSRRSNRLSPLVAAILAVCMSHAALAEAKPPSSASQSDRPEMSEPMQTSLRKLVTAMLLSSVRKTNLGTHSVARFRQEIDRVVAATAMNDLFLIETQLKINLRPDGTANPEGEGEVTINVSLDGNKFTDVVTLICRNTLPEISAAERKHAELICP